MTKIYKIENTITAGDVNETSICFQIEDGETKSEIYPTLEEAIVNWVRPFGHVTLGDTYKYLFGLDKVPKVWSPEARYDSFYQMNESCAMKMFCAWVLQGKPSITLVSEKEIIHQI